MGNAIESIVETTKSFFIRVKEVICDAFNALATVIINGVKTVVSYFKKIIEYVWNGITIIGKLLYVGGKKIIHILSNKLGIPYLIQYFQDFKNKGIKVYQNNTQIDPKAYLEKLKEQISPRSQVTIKLEIKDNPTQEDEEKSIRDFKEHDDLDSLGFKLSDSVAIVGNKEIKLDNLSRRNNTNYSNYSDYSKFGNNHFRNYYY